MLLEVDVKPFALRGTGFTCCRCNQRGPNSLHPVVLGDHRVQDEGVGSTVPDDVDEADQGVSFPRADPAQALALKPWSPVGLSDRVSEALGVERVEGSVVEATPPLVSDRHVSIVRSAPRRLT